MKVLFLTASGNCKANLENREFGDGNTHQQSSRFRPSDVRYFGYPVNSKDKKKPQFFKFKQNENYIVIYNQSLAIWLRKLSFFLFPKPASLLRQLSWALAVTIASEILMKLSKVAN